MNNRIPPFALRVTTACLPLLLAACGKDVPPPPPPQVANPMGLSGTMNPEAEKLFSGYVLERMAEGGGVHAIRIGVGEAGRFDYAVT